MKLTLISLLFSSVALANNGDKLVSCELQSFQNCEKCEKRIPVSCENHAFNGSLDLKLKPQKIEWTISHPKLGTEKNLITDNSKLSLKDLKNSKSLKSLLMNQKVKMEKEERVTVSRVYLSPQTALYKNQKGTEIAALMKPMSQLRQMASAQPESPIAGGVRKPQKPKEQK